MNVSCGVIITHRNKILLGHVTNNKFWDIPKGIKELNEDFVSCAIREVKEETGLVIEPGPNLKHIGLYQYSHKKNIYLFQYDLPYLPKLTDLKCTSYFDYQGKELPELDKYKYVDINAAHLFTNDKLGLILNKIFNIPFSFNQSEKIRRTICYILRHKINENTKGWLDKEELIKMCIEVNPVLSILDIDDFMNVIKFDKEDRFSIKDNLIKVNYGHSANIQVENLIEVKPPDVLYHNTFDCFYNNIMAEGLKPMSRNYVFMATTSQKASDYRKKVNNDNFNKIYGYPTPIMLRIDARGAYEEGIRFYKQSTKIICADYIPFKYIKKVDNFNDKITDEEINRLIARCK